MHFNCRTSTVLQSIVDIMSLQSSPFVSSIFWQTLHDFILRSILKWWVGSFRIPMPWFPFFLWLNHLFSFPCPSLLRDIAALIVLNSCSLLSHTGVSLSLLLLLSVLLSHCRRFLGETSWFGKFSLPPSSPSATSAGEHVMRNRAPRELSLGHCMGLCLYMTFLLV